MCRVEFDRHCVVLWLISWHIIRPLSKQGCPANIEQLTFLKLAKLKKEILLKKIY